jgi:hypothetical protein
MITEELRKMIDWTIEYLIQDSIEDGGDCPTPDEVAICVEANHMVNVMCDENAMLYIKSQLPLMD